MNIYPCSAYTKSHNIDTVAVVTAALRRAHGLFVCLKRVGPKWHEFNANFNVEKLPFLGQGFFFLPRRFFPCSKATVHMQPIAQVFKTVECWLLGIFLPCLVAGIN